MTRNSSLREFAKHKRANSWQSTEIFCGIFEALVGGGSFLECGLGFFGFLVGIFGACSTNSAKFAQTLAI